MKPDKTELLKQEYLNLNKSIDSFGFELSRQIQNIFEENNINLGFPIQTRTKSWDSIENKIKTLKINSILDMQDLCGLRFVLLFKRDIEKVKSIISNNFKVIKAYDTQERLDSDQFGYSSFHIVIKMPENWFDLPTLKGFKELKAEIQIRTLAQHTWAAASHVLQYKSEENVPKSILRAIYRVSAILEIVDVEFERFLEEREQYIHQLNNFSSEELSKTILNVNILEKILDEYFPPENKTLDEDYSELLDELKLYNITSAEEVINLIKKHLPLIIEKDSITALKYHKDHYFSHSGLLRCCYELENPAKWKILTERWKEL
jgi:ppGpp synthetase/RelA/SpoT-type nucleotidyltranferase